MKKKSLIPPLITAFTIEQKLEKQFRAWEKIIKDISPLVKVITPLDPDFNPDKFSIAFKQFLVGEHKKVYLGKWPEKHEIAFIVGVNSGMPGHGPQYLIQDVCILCFGGLAIGVHDYEQDHFLDTKIGYDYSYTLSDFGNPKILKWKHKIWWVGQRILDLEKQVPDLPGKDE